MSKPVLLSGGNGKAKELAGTTNGQFLVNNGSNEVVFSSATAPTAGQVPVWSGSAWAPGTISPGGGGGGGLTYLLNYSVVGASPTPSGTWKQLSLTPTTDAYNTGAGAVTAPNGGTYANLANFVTLLAEPGATTTPPGFWDLNVYLTSTGAADETLFRFSIHKWDGTTLSAPIATSANVSITNPAAITLYTASVFVPSTVLSATERIAIKVEVTRTTANAHTVTGYFEGVYYTHMHTTLGAPGSTGLVKVVNGIIQAPATLLVNADVSDTAAISVSKISGAAPLASPTFTGTPRAPTATAGDSSTQIATTAFIANTFAGYASLSGAVFTGGLVTAAATASRSGFRITPTGTPPTVLSNGDMWVAENSNPTQLGLFARLNSHTVEFVQTAGATFTGRVKTAAPSGVTAGFALTLGTAPTSPSIGDIWMTNTGLFFAGDTGTAQVAPLASPTFTGTVTIPAGASISGYLTTASAASTYAPLASPTFTGTVTIPAGASISGYLTTATAASTYAPLASPTFTGTVTIPGGASISGYAPLASPTFSGSPSLPTGTTGVTQSAGDNSTKLATTAFVVAAVVASSGIPYDLPAEIPGTPATSTKVVNFKAVRTFILATTGHEGGQLTAPSGNFICTVKKNATTLGTITFGASSFSSSITGTLGERTFAATDVLSVETPSAALGIDTPFFTLAMTLA